MGGPVHVNRAWTGHRPVATTSVLWRALSSAHQPLNRKQNSAETADTTAVFANRSLCSGNQTSNIQHQTSVKIVLAYSGGLDTSIILRWLKENYQAEVNAFCADIGHEEELAGLEAKALKTGAAKCIIEDLREEFARDFIFPMFQAGAIYEGQYFLGTSIARPLIAKRMVEIARAEKADAIAHGATGKGNDQVRFELAAAALAPELRVIAPWREERFRKQFPGRAELIAFAKKNGIPVEASAEKPYSMDRNLLHISYESGVLEDPWFDASSLEMRSMYKLSVAPEEAPDEPEYVDLAFEKGICVAVNGKSLSPLQVMQTLNQLG